MFASSSDDELDELLQKVQLDEPDLDGTGLQHRVSTLSTAPSVDSTAGGSSSSPLQPSYPGFTPVLSTQGRRGLYRGGFNLKVVQAKMTWQSAGHPDFLKLGQTFITLSESTANIHHVTTAVKAEFRHGYVLVTADGLEVRDSTGLGVCSIMAASKTSVMYIFFTSLIPCLQA